MSFKTHTTPAIITVSGVTSLSVNGNPITTENPLPVQLSDGSINIDTLDAQLEVHLSHLDNTPDIGDVFDSIRIGDGTNQLSINPDGTINVNSVISDGNNSITVDSPQLPASLTVSGNIKSSLEEIRNHVSIGNSTTAPLTASGVFTGVAESTLSCAVISINVYSDQASAFDGLKIEYSQDGANWDHNDTFTIPANTGKFFTLPPEGSFFRVVYINNSISQSVFRLQTHCHPLYVKPSSHSIRSNITDEEDAELVRSIISAKTSNDTYVNILATTDGRLKVAQSIPETPNGSISKSQFFNGLVGAMVTDEGVYTITNGKTLHIQRFTGGAETSTAGATVELVYRPTGLEASDIIINIGYVNGSNFQFDLSDSIMGDGTAQIVIKRTNNGGGSMRITGRWVGYEE